MHLIIIAGARPNFMKIAPIIRAIQERDDTTYQLVHTGQHYDEKMSGTFFRELAIPKPDVNLEVGSGTHAKQTAQIMVKFEKFLQAQKADCVVVVGDVNSTAACSLVAKKLHIAVAHIEAGLRSRDLTMPEEINRMVTDAISDYYYTTTHDASSILLHEGKSKDKIEMVGNTMIDTLIFNLNKLQQPSFYQEQDLSVKNYYLLTLHRPSNVDSFNKLLSLLKELDSFVGDKAIIFPIHPRTRKTLEQHDVKFKNIRLVEPQGYLNFLFLLKNCKAVVTDSGGIQEEATYLKVPCLTLRNNTERPETITIGSNELIGDDIDLLKVNITKIKNNQWKHSAVPEYWDGQSAKRIIDHLANVFN